MKKLSMEPQVLYEDPDILAVNKPAGLVVHSDGRTKEKTLTDWVLTNYPKTAKVGEPLTLSDGRVVERPGIVHRLDRETSGVILIAKTKKGYEYLKKQFQERTIVKKYLTLVHGEMSDTYGIINRPIGKSPRDFRRFSATRGARGELREAETWWTALAHDSGVSLLEVEPKTGRTHQIRVHLKAVNHPVLCDRLYAPEKPCLLGLERTALHAWSINFKNVKGKAIEIKAPWPKDFDQALARLNLQEFAKKRLV